MERRRVRFTGRVQGVGFRATARAIASRHAVTGWVRNEQDGSVLMEVQGSESKVGAFLSELQGEMGPLVASADSQEVAVTQGEASFDVRF